MISSLTIPLALDAETASPSHWACSEMEVFSAQAKLGAVLANDAYPSGDKYPSSVILD